MCAETTIEEKRKKAYGPENAHAVINSLSKEETDYKRMALERLVRAKRAGENLIDFAQFTMPDPDCPEDSSRSKYEVKRHHQALAATLEEIAKACPSFDVQKWLRSTML